MIVGTVNANNEITFDIPIEDRTGAEQSISVLMDTGFSGWLTLPKWLVTQLGLPWYSRSRSALADGTTIEVDIYLAMIRFDGLQRAVAVQVIENAPLIGMKLLAGHDLKARVLPGGRAEIEKIP